MVDTLLADVVNTAPHTSAHTDVTDRRRAGRMHNPSPELIALMRKPTLQAKARVALYDAPNFILPSAEPRFSAPNPWHMARMVGAATICVTGWASALALMVAYWG